MLEHTSRRDERLRIEQMLKTPQPILCNGYINACKADQGLWDIDNSNERYLPWTRHATHKSAPVSARMFSVTHLVSDNGLIIDDWKSAEHKKLSTIYLELEAHFNALNCPASFIDIDHNISGAEKKQIFMVLPHIRIEKSGDDIVYKIDKEAAEIFYGYLMYRGFVTRQEVREVGSGYVNCLEENPELEQKFSSLGLERKTKLEPEKPDFINSVYPPDPLRTSNHPSR